MREALRGRGVTDTLLAALTEAPVTVVTGPRQSGKSTLVRDLIAARHPATYYTLDDLGVLESALGDPQGFVASLPSAPVVIDEVQLAPGLFRAIKLIVDADRRPGRFLLTGSADPLLMPAVSESLAGRARTITLWPFTQGEISGRPDTFIDRLFGAIGPLGVDSGADRAELISRIVRGGFPEAVALEQGGPRERWMSDYVVRIVERDVPRMSEIADRLAIPRLLQALGSRSMQLLNLSEIGRLTQIKRATLDRYVGLVAASYLLRLIPAWSPDIARRAGKRPKPLVTDSGLLCHLLRADERRLREDPNLLGPVLESFAAVELLRQATWSNGHIELLHYRTDTDEVDIVLEDSSGRIVGIEVKATPTPTMADFAGLRALSVAAGARFHRGVLLHTGTVSLPFGSRMQAMPVGSLWQG
ncbi:MAG TPA: ATP-binding protein [Coriobacteriia bacterium]